MNTLQFAQMTTTSTSTSTLDAETAAMVTVVTVFVTLIGMVLAYVLAGILYGKIFKKAGIPSWIAWVPVYNSWKIFEIGGQHGYWAILSFIPFVNFVAAIFSYISMYNIGLKFGKQGTFVLLAIFFPIVWVIWLAFDKSTWNNAAGAPSRAIEHLAPTQTPPAAPTATPPVAPVL